MPFRRGGEALGGRRSRAARSGAARSGAARRRNRVAALAALRRVYRNPDLRLLQLSAAANLTAEVAYFVALSVFAYEHGGAAALGAVGVARMVPMGAAALFASLAVDRYPRERLLAVVEAARALVAAGSVTAVLTGAPAGVLVGLGALVFVVSAVLRPAEWSLPPLLARTPDELTAANLARSLTDGVGWLLGPALGGTLIAAWGPGAAFAAAAGGFAVAAVLSARISATRPPGRVPLHLGGVLAGVRALTRRGPMRLPAALFVTQAAVHGAFDVLVVVASVDLLGLGRSGVGLLIGAYGVGSVAGAILALTVVGRRRLATPFAAGLVLWGLPIATLAAWPNRVAAVLLSAAPGLANSIVNVSGITLLQRVTPDHVLGRLFGALESGFKLGHGVGAAAAAALVAAFGPRTAMLAVGLVLPVVVAAVLPALRRVDDAAAVLEREIRLLRSVPLFAPLPAVALEQLARALRPMSAKAGSMIIAQATQGDRLYLVANGVVDVVRDGRMVAALGPGDHFGEIALLRRVPRTASVVARGDAELFMLDGDDFLAAVSAHPTTRAAADQVVAVRLGAGGFG